MGALKMSTLQIAKDILWNDFLKVILIEPSTGAYEVVKGLADPSGDEDSLLEEKDIFSYMQKLADEWLVHPDDTVRYIKVLHNMMNTGLSETLDGHRVSRKLRYRVGGKYIWTSFEIIYPFDFTSGGGRSCVFAIRRADSALNSINSPLVDMTDLALGFIKVLKIDLTNDSFEVLKLPSEDTAELPPSDKFSNWVGAFAASKNIHPDDANQFKVFTDIEHMKILCLESREPKRCRYRRRVGDSFKWVAMELVPGVEYTDDHQVVMLYVRYIIDDNLPQPDAGAAVKSKDTSRDVLTGFKDRAEMNKDISEIEEKLDDMMGVGVLYATVNGMSTIIGKLGQDTYKGVVKKFSDLLTDRFLTSRCYRLSGDEFAVIQPDVKQASFSSWARDLRVSTKLETPPIASVGFAWDRHPDTIAGVIGHAEQMMEIDKIHTLEKFPELGA